MAEGYTEAQVDRAQKINQAMPMLLGVLAMTAGGEDAEEIDTEFALDALVYLTAMLLEANPKFQTLRQMRLAADDVRDQMVKRMKTCRAIHEQTGVPMIHRFAGLASGEAPTSTNGVN